MFQRYRGVEMGKEELQNITDDVVEEIYQTGYWDKCKCDDLPGGVDYVVFDQAVNSGPGRSAKWLQTVIGVAVDGGIGPQTLAAVGAKTATEIIDEMCDTRLEFLQAIRDGSLWETFGRGWQRRVDGVRVHGRLLAGGVPDLATELVPDPAPEPNPDPAPITDSGPDPAPEPNPDPTPVTDSGPDRTPDPDLVTVPRDPGPEAAPEPVLPSVDYDIVRSGSRGEWVRKLQEALEVGADGIFGAGTEAALKSFQEEAGLTSDGIAGRNTYQALGLMA